MKFQTIDIEKIEIYTAHLFECAKWINKLADKETFRKSSDEKEAEDLVKIREKAEEDYRLAEKWLKEAVTVDFGEKKK